MDKKLEQMVEDLERILNLFKKMENSPIEDVDTLKKESILIQEELKERYDKSDTGETDPQET